MITQKTQLELKINEKDHTYQCPPNVALMECLEALNTFRSYIYGRIKEVEEQEKSKVVAQESPKEKISEEIIKEGE